MLHQFVLSSAEALVETKTEIKKIKHSTLNVVFVRLEANVAPCLCANMKLQQIFKAILL